MVAANSSNVGLFICRGYRIVKRWWSLYTSSSVVLLSNLPFRLQGIIETRRSLKVSILPTGNHAVRRISEWKRRDHCSASLSHRQWRIIARSWHCKCKSCSAREIPCAMIRYHTTMLHVCTGGSLVSWWLRLYLPIATADWGEYSNMRRVNHFLNGKCYTSGDLRNFTSAEKLFKNSVWNRLCS